MQELFWDLLYAVPVRSRCGHRKIEYLNLQWINLSLLTGGTIDIVAHKVRKDGKIRELFRATGGAWGGTMIDLQFVTLLNKIFGEEFITAFQQEFPKDYVELLQDFEIKKRGECDSVRVSLPYNFCNFKHDGRSVQDCIRQYASVNDSQVKFSSGKLVLSSDVVESLFKDSLHQINDHIEHLLLRPKLRDLNYIFLVGGFAESARLQTSIKTAFGDRVTVLIPEEASLSVVKGAVAFGCDPKFYLSKNMPLYVWGGVLFTFWGRRT